MSSNTTYTRKTFLYLLYINPDFWVLCNASKSIFSTIIHICSSLRFFHMFLFAYNCTYWNIYHPEPHTVYHLSLEYNPSNINNYSQDGLTLSESMWWQPEPRKPHWQVFCTAEAAGTCWYQVHRVLTWSHRNPWISEDRWTLSLLSPQTWAPRMFSCLRGEEKRKQAFEAFSRVLDGKATQFTFLFCIYWFNCNCWLWLDFPDSYPVTCSPRWEEAASCCVHLCRSTHLAGQRLFGDSGPFKQACHLGTL